MTTPDWRRVIDQARSLGAVTALFIGGEPTLHPDLPILVDHALRDGMAVEVYSNLVRVPEQMWRVFDAPGVRLATSYYSHDPGEHDSMTGRRSHQRTLSNIREALHRGIPVRVGIVAVRDGQRVRDALKQMKELGVMEVGIDRVREVGRGVGHRQAGLDQLCGACAGGKLAVSPTGDVWPCVFARWLPLGNVHHSRLRRSMADRRPHRCEQRWRRRSRNEPPTAGRHAGRTTAVRGQVPATPTTTALRSS